MGAHAAATTDAPAPAPAGGLVDASAPAGPPTPPAPTRPRQRRARWVLLAAVLLVLLLLAGAAWLASRALVARDALLGARDAAGDLMTAVDDGDLAAASAAAPRLRDAAARADAATAGPVWGAATHLPVLGDDLAAVRTAADGLHRLATDALDPVLAAGGLGPDLLRPVDGRFDLAPLAAASPALDAAAGTARQVADDLDAVDADALLPEVRDALVPARGQLGGLADRLATAASVARLAPGMLGADAPRTYLVLFVNPAELRSGGGIVGSVAEVSVANGRLTLVRQAAAQGVGGDDAPALPLTAEESAAFGPVLGDYLQNATMTPDFPRTGALAAASWQRETGHAVDGVLAVDPVALSYVLRATGPVADGTGTTLDAGTLAGALLDQSYRRFPAPGDSDAYFARATSAAFGALTGPAVDGSALVRGLVSAAGEGRLRVWSADATEQAELVGTPVGGAFLSGPGAGDVGVFLNDGTEGKLDYHLESAVVAGRTCAAGDAPGSATVTVTLRSTLTPEAAAGLPAYVVGPSGATGIPAGTVRTAVDLYTPVGGEFGELTLATDGGAPAPVGGRVLDAAGRAMQRLSVDLPPGGQAVLTARVTLPAGADDAALVTTPTLGSGGGTALPACVRP